MKQKLKELMNGLVDAANIPDIDIAGITYDSRQVKPGYLFAALPGTEHDGHDYVSQAISNGASIVIGSQSLTNLSVPYICVDSPRRTLAIIAARFNGDPTRDMPVIGITGTNGKTTCSYLIESILSTAGYRPAVVGTINYRYGSEVTTASHTTPEAVDLQAWIAAAKTGGANALVMEISSHGIAMDRARACHLDIAAFTNLSQDHLDFHGTLEDYFETKRRLFTELLPESLKDRKTAVVNWDDSYGQELSASIDIPTIRIGSEEGMDYRATAAQLDANGIRATIQTPDGSFPITSPLIGEFNLHNILLSIACCHLLGVSFHQLAEGVHNLNGVPGRLERVANNRKLKVFVDYAHTPDALRRVLEAVKGFTSKGRLITVFGCGGDRDPEKRPLMGNTVARLSDIAIVTSDNPRTEDAQQIIDQIIPGIRAQRITPYEEKSRRGYMIEADRRKAIFKAIELARPNDIVVLAGKGHEDYQILGKDKIHFDDREEALKACEALG